MRNATGIEIDQLIVHILNPRQPGGMVLSERLLPLDQNQALADYFVAHIENSLQDPAAVAACFVTLRQDEPSGIAQSLLAGELDLVAGSRALATRLHSIIARDARISPGDLVAAFYRAANYPEVPRFLALLKVDPSEVFRHRTQRDPQGRLYVSFELEQDIMPTTRERLQKSAFVQPLLPRPEYDMMLLDRQTRVTGPVPLGVARFFAETFLGAAPALDARQRTDRLYRSLVSAQNRLRADLPPQQNELLRQAIDTAIGSASVNFDAWLEALPLSEAHKREIDLVVSQELPDREFTIDTGYAARLMRKRRFRGDYNLRVEVAAEHLNQVVQSVERIEAAGEPAYYRVVIHTETWTEVPQ